MTRRHRVDVRLSELEEFNVGLALSDPISHRLDALAELVEAMGERTDRKELVAALILAAVPDGNELAAVLRRYRTARVRDTLLDPDAAPSLVAFPRRRPGPRGRRRKNI